MWDLTAEGGEARVSRGAGGPCGGRGRTIAKTLLLVLTLGSVLGGCTIPFGNGGEPTSQSPEETRRERNRLYMEEQERMERSRQFERVGPSDR